MSQTLYHLLQQSASAHPARPAVEFAGATLSYRELLDAADRAAVLFLRYGAGPGRRMAFSFRKSVDAMIALFGVIRTGATYVPLDPAWPAERVRMICEDAGVRLWLGTEAPHNIDGIETAIVTIATDDAVPLESWRQFPPDTGEAPEPADGIANILFTSGSTGRPKGVRITTQSLLHYSQWAVDYFNISSEDRLANHAPYHFDLSTLDIFAAVRAGAAMIPVPEGVKMFPYQMAKLIADTRISVWYSVPSALIMMQLRGKLAEHDLSRLRHVIFAGEVMPKPALREIARLLPHATLTNLYGPTETNVCTYHAVSREELANDEPVPIGLPVSDTRVWVVDDALRPVPTGASGELLVAGPTVTTGYHDDDELTARKLVPAPDGRGAAYRTGDRVRDRADGVLLFEGRIDRMIKCRGHRIEPGEIEAALAAHPRVKEVAIVPLPDPVFGNRIKACIALRDGDVESGAGNDEAGLAAWCRERLPVYMLPDVWQFYPALPRTDREKVDLLALAR